LFRRKDSCRQSLNKSATQLWNITQATVVTVEGVDHCPPAVSPNSLPSTKSTLSQTWHG